MEKTLENMIELITGIEQSYVHSSSYTTTTLPDRVYIRYDMNRLNGTL